MIKQLFTQGRPQARTTQELIHQFRKYKKMSRQDVICLCRDDTDNRLKYLRQHGFIKTDGRGNWEIIEEKK